MDSENDRSQETSSVVAGQNPVQAQLKALQIIRGAIIAGPLAFMVIALLLNQGDLEFKFEVLEILALVMSMGALSAYFLIDKFFVMKDVDAIRSLPIDGIDAALAARICSQEIIKAALLEGATIFGFLLIIIDQSMVGLILGVLLIIVSIATFPTSTRFAQKLESLKFRVGL